MCQITPEFELFVLPSRAALELRLDKYFVDFGVKNNSCLQFCVLSLLNGSAHF